MVSNVFQGLTIHQSINFLILNAFCFSTDEGGLSATEMCMGTFQFLFIKFLPTINIDF